jgi:hypothetical protein
LLREAVFGTAALAMALGLAVWVTDFDLAAWVNPASANVGSTSSFDERFGPGSARRSLGFNYPWRPAARSNFDAEFGHIESQLGGRSREEQNVQPEPPAPTVEVAIPLPRVRPVLANLQSTGGDPASVSSDNRICSKLADLVPMPSRWLADPGMDCSASERICRRSATTVRRPSMTFRPKPFTCRTVPSSRHTLGSAA